MHVVIEKGWKERAPEQNAGEPVRRNRRPKHANARAAIVDWTRVANGDGLLCIDGGPQFTVKRAQADLFEVLLEDRGEDDDSLIDWKEQNYILVRVGCKGRTRLTPGNLRTRTHRLRDALERAGYDRWLIQGHAGRGMRFALLRSS